MSDNDDCSFNGGNHHSPSPPSSSPPPDTPTLRPPTSRTPPSFPAREDCWTQDATRTLVEAWGAHYIQLNRGNLRQKHWQQVADAVNAIHAHTKKQYRTDIQCKNRIDTLKKRYKVEKSQTLLGISNYVSSWPFFNSLDSLIGDSFLKNSLSVSPPPEVAAYPAAGATRRSSLSAAPASGNSRRSSQAGVVASSVWKLPQPLQLEVPVGPRSKRPVSEEALSRRNFSAMAAAAARAADDDDDNDDEGSNMSGAGIGCRKESREDLVMADGYRRLAEAIGRFAEVYQRVEESKQRQVVELEKQRMQFTKDLEIQRMKLFMESQVRLQRIKRVKRMASNS